MTVPSSLNHPPRDLLSLDPAQPALEENDALCESCSYSLIALTGDRCPECGATFDPTALPLARVPWLHRKRLGAAWAFIVTTWRILTRPYAFAAEWTWPVRDCFDDARRYRAICIRLAVVSLVLAGCCCTIVTPLFSVKVTRGDFAISMISILLMAIPLHFLFSHATNPGIFHWGSLLLAQSISHPPRFYISAPLALVPVGAFCVVVYWCAQMALRNENVLNGLVFLLCGIAAAVAGLLWWTAQRFAAASGVPRAKRISMAVRLPAYWTMIVLATAGVAVFVMFGAVALLAWARR